MTRTIKGNYATETFWSLPEFADASATSATDARTNAAQCGKSFTGVDTFDDAITLAKRGWHDQLDVTLEIAESAVKLAEQEHMMDTFMPVWDVTGAEVDVARYLSGEPECMIDFPLTRTSKSGRVITLVASVCYSAALSRETVIKRGQVMVALALALSRLGHATEIWADYCTEGGQARLYGRVLVKGSDDEIDPASLLFALAHPAMLRCLKFGVADGLPKEKFKRVRYGSYGHPAPRNAAEVKQFPEGTIFLPELRSGSDVPDADEFLRKYLGELGLLAE